MGVALLGYRGSGKTSVGRQLAQRLGKPFIDLDAAVVEAAQVESGAVSIRELFERFGETHFRDLESAALCEVIRSDAVIATGGGVVLREANRTALTASSHARIYLKCGATELHRRIHADPATAANRPALTHLGGGIDEIEALLAVREPLYAEVASATVDVTALSVDEVVRSIEGRNLTQMHADTRR